ncbi:pyruvate kinase [Culicoidibacter larvae]|uniref:Pyruvate kinase n=1 Tax=Culicoidibacter larvae TaxID=2579976 RepID=A0A5R8QA30_9FIRM|nr:pyruvate kinase [Culicoidibacter larvae]TLG72485.1 pyruvate kinase [Culicoidibacter larvae]
MNLKLTKQVSTIGPKSEPKEVMTELVKSGMNVIRLNFSHGDYEEHGGRVKTIREINKELGTNVAILLDTKGPEIRTHLFENGGVDFVKGQTVRVSMKEVLGTSELFSVTHADLINDVEIGGTILLDDGYCELTVTGKEDGVIVCTVVNNAYIKDRRGVNIPGAILSMPFLSDKDRNDILWGCEVGVDFIALSFTRRPEDVIEIRELLNANGGEHIQIIPKIENQESVDKIEEIVAVSEGIMVARGDLGVEVPAEDVPVMQKHIIKVCNSAGKPVITATQMLESMQKNPRPTRAEVSDVANAVFDGTDAVMLSGESAAGDYPVEAVETQSRIAHRIEQELDFEYLTAYASTSSKGTIEGAIGLSVADAVMDLNAKAVVAITRSGATARTLSKFRPAAPIIAVVPTEEVARSLALCWGVLPIVKDLTGALDDILEDSAAIAKDALGLQAGDIAVLTAGMPQGQGNTNLLRIKTIR